MTTPDTDSQVSPPSNRVKRILSIVGGWLLIGLGIIGLFVPILQGVALILLGLVVLSRESVRARAMLRRFRYRHPKLDERFRRLQQRLRRPVRPKK